MEKEITEQDNNANFDGWEYVGFWWRVGASLIDSILIAIITTPLLYTIYGEAYWQKQDISVLGLPDFLISWVFPALAIILFWLYKSATPGKMLIDAKVVDAKTGGKLSAAQCVGRYLSYFISMLPLGLGFLWVAFDPKKQGWHDKIAGAVVIRRTEEKEKVEFTNKEG